MGRRALLGSSALGAADPGHADVTTLKSKGAGIRGAGPEPSQVGESRMGSGARMSMEFLLDNFLKARKPFILDNVA